MYRIDNSSSSSSLPAPTADGAFPGNYFVDKNPALGVEGTVVPAEWFNAVTEELAHLITDSDGGNVPLSKASRTQLKEAILTMLSNSQSGIPAGAMMDWPDDDLPDGGWDWADGGELNRVTHSRLFARIGTRYGIGDGVTTFNKPDRRGRGSIGTDNMGGNSANRVTAASTGGGNASTIGGTGGAETHSLTDEENGPHNHGNMRNPAADTDRSGGGGNCASNSNQTMPDSGLGTPHNNMGPWIAFPVIIKL